MALIRCEKCGRQITDTIRKCPHCGQKNLHFRNIPLEKIKSKKIVILTIVVILVFASIGAILCINEFKEKNELIQLEANKLTEEEQIGIRAIKKIKNNLKDSDSLNVYEIWYRKTNVAEEQLLIEFSYNKNNSKNIVELISNENIVGDDTKADRSIGKYTSETEKDEISKAKEIKELWDTKGGYIEPFTKLDKDKILRNLQ